MYIDRPVQPTRQKHPNQTAWTCALVQPSSLLTMTTSSQMIYLAIELPVTAKIFSKILRTANPRKKVSSSAMTS